MPRGRPKKTTAATKEEAAAAVLDTSAADTILEGQKGKFSVAVVVGLLPDGNIDLATNNTNYAILQWLLERAKYELLLHEKQTYAQQQYETKIN